MNWKNGDAIQAGKENRTDQDQQPVNPDQQRARVEIDPLKVKMLRARLEAQQNFPLGVAGGLVAAVIGAAIWAAVTVATKHQIGWMAVGVGFLVGFTIRGLGKGISTRFGVAGAILALFGCLFGNLLSAVAFLAQQESVSFWRALSVSLQQPALAFDLLKATFSPMDVLFYGIALYEGYKFSFRQITEEELSSLTA